MDVQQRTKLFRQRAAAKSSLTRIQTYICEGERKTNDLQARYENLPSIVNKFESAQNELEQSDDFDHSEERELFEEQYYQIKARFMELLYPPNANSRPASPDHASENASQHGSNAGSTHSSSVHIKLPTIQLPSYDGDHCKWLNFRDTFESLIVQNSLLSNVQRFHYLLAALKGEAKTLITNLAITNDNFTVAWNLITERYNNVKLIARQHVNQLFQMPQTKKGDATSLRQLINHVTSNFNALQALALNTPIQSLMLTHMMLSVLDNETHKC